VTKNLMTGCSTFQDYETCSTNPGSRQEACCWRPRVLEQLRAFPSAFAPTLERRMIARFIMRLEIVDDFVNTVDTTHDRKQLRYFRRENRSTQRDASILRRHVDCSRMRNHATQF